MQPERHGALERRAPQLCRRAVLVHGVARLVDNRPQGSAQIALVEAGRDPDVRRGDRGREGVRGRIDPIRVAGQRQSRHDVSRQPFLRAQREAAVKTGIVDRVATVRERRDERANPVAELFKGRRDLGRRRPRLEVVEQRIVRVLEALEPLEALGVAPSRGRRFARRNGRKDSKSERSRASAHACSPREDARVISARRSAGTRRALSHSRRATRTRLASNGVRRRPVNFGCGRLQQPPELVRDQPLVADAERASQPGRPATRRPPAASGCARPSRAAHGPGRGR